VGAHVRRHPDLTDSAIRAVKPREKAYKVADEKGLYLQVTPSSGRWWRVKSRAPGVDLDHLA
jgi:hypothetical protein